MERSFFFHANGHPRPASGSPSRLVLAAIPRQFTGTHLWPRAGQALLIGALSMAAFATPADDDAPEVIITAPAWYEIAVGQTRLATRVTPAPGRRVVEVRFFVDGTRIATLTEPPFETFFDAGTTPAAHTLRVEAEDDQGAVGVNLSSTRHVTYEEEVHVEATAIPRHAILVSVVDKQRRPVTDLRRSEFSLRVDGEEQKLTEVSRDERPLSVELLLDVSGSIAPHLPLMMKASERFVSMLEPEDGAALTLFAGTIVPVAPFSHQHLATREIILSLRLSTSQGLVRAGVENTTLHEMDMNSTRLYDALAHAIETVNSRPGQRAIVVFTDAYEHGSQVRRKDIESVVRQANVSLDFVRFGDRPAGAWGETGQLIRAMRKLAVESGGQEWPVKRPEQIAPAFHDLARRLKHRYRLVFAADTEKFDARKARRLQVRVARKKVEVLHPASIHLGR